MAAPTSKAVDQQQKQAAVTENSGDDRSISPSTVGGASSSSAAGATTMTMEDFIGNPGTGAKYERVKLVGKGSFGKGWQVKRTSDKALLVAKEMDMSAMSPRDIQYVKSEIECLASCSHFAIIQFVESVAIGQTMIIVMEWADAGDLNMQIKSRAADQNNMQYFEEHEVGYTFIQIALALEHVHSRKMLHRDIKGANVFLKTNGLVSLADFGFSHKYESTVSGDVASTFCGTPYYLAPETWRRQPYSKKADVWSLGILLFEMMSLKRPFIGQGMNGLKDAVLKMSWTTPLPSKFSKDLQEVCMSILNPDPNIRPSIQQVLETPYCKKLLSDFERSVEASPLIDAATKASILKDLSEAGAQRAAAAKKSGPVGQLRTDIAYEGPIRKDSSGTWKERYFVLRDGVLTITVRKGDAESKSLTIAMLASVVPVSPDIAKAEGVFALYTKDRKAMWMQAPSKEEMLEWVNNIQLAMGVA